MAVPSVTRVGGLGRLQQLQEGVMLGFARPHAVVAGRLKLGGELLGIAYLAAYAAVDLHGSLLVTAPVASRRSMSLEL